MWMFAGLFSILVITTATAQSCPANQIASDVQFIIHGDNVVPASEVRQLPSLVRDPAHFDANLTFFSEVLGYSDDEIQQEVQNALQFFSERFGLDFSLTEPNELGLRFFQNATLQPIRPITQISATLNRWILTGNTKTKCFPATVGGFHVTFSGEQTLRGTYGGAEGIGVPNDRSVRYLYYSISVSPPCVPIVIQKQSPIPLEDERIGVNQLYVIFYEVSHRTLGRGAEHGIVQSRRFTAANGTSFFRQSGSAVLTFPPNVLTFN